MKASKKVLLGSAIGAGALIASLASASAAIVCSGNVCWHTATKYEYPAESRVIVHEDSWKPAADARITFREHTGRGYWRDEKWVEW